MKSSVDGADITLGRFSHNSALNDFYETEDTKLCYEEIWISLGLIFLVFYYIAVV